MRLSKQAGVQVGLGKAQQDAGLQLLMPMREPLAMQRVLLGVGRVSSQPSVDIFGVTVDPVVGRSRLRRATARCLRSALTQMVMPCERSKLNRHGAFEAVGSGQLPDLGL